MSARHSEDGRQVDARSYASAILNILEDAAEEKARLSGTQSAVLNILDDFTDEKKRLDATQKALLNILDDSVEEKARLAETQRAALNILEDFDLEKKKVEEFNIELRNEIAERTRAEEALRLAKASAEAVSRELEAFAYTVSHDLRAPLRHIAGFIELLDRGAGPTLDEKSRRYLRLVSESSQKMGALIDDLLNLSRIGRAAIAWTQVSLHQLVEEARQELAPAMAGRNIEWRIGPLPEVWADRVLLRDAVSNLLSNALKYTFGRNPSIIEIEAIERPAEVVMFVRDNGVGFDMRFVHKLFGVFQRLHPSGQFEGTGVGLASVRRIIERHGGQAWAEGEANRGATFYFSLPKKEPEQ